MPSISRERTLSFALFVWEAGVGLGLQQGLFDRVPSVVVAIALTAPPLIFFATRETIRRYTKRHPRMSLLLFLSVFLLLGYAAWFITFKAQPKRADAGQNDPKAISALDDRIAKLSDALTKSPSVDPSAQLSILKDEHDRLSAKKDEFTKQEKDALDNQAITLDSLEAGRKRYLEAKEIEKRQRELAVRKEQIESEEAAKNAAKTLELDEIEFAKRYTPILDHAITSLYRLLREASKDSIEAISTDFPSDPPSIYGSKMLKDGKIVEGRQVIRVGADKNWEFQFQHPGAPDATQRSHWGRHLALVITAGNASARIDSLPLLQPGPTQLRLTLHILSEWQKPIGVPLYQQDCSLTEYQKPMERLFNELIQNRYNAAPLKPKL